MSEPVLRRSARIAARLQKQAQTEPVASQPNTKTAPETKTAPKTKKRPVFLRFCDVMRPYHVALVDVDEDVKEKKGEVVLSPRRFSELGRILSQMWCNIIYSNEEYLIMAMTEELRKRNFWKKMDIQPNERLNFLKNLFRKMGFNNISTHTADVKYLK